MAERKPTAAEEAAKHKHEAEQKRQQEQAEATRLEQEAEQRRLADNEATRKLAELEEQESKKATATDATVRTTDFSKVAARPADTGKPGAATEASGRQSSIRDRADELVRQGAKRPATPEQEQQAFITGFNFDLYELTELYANMRDGNYWSAFRTVVRILNDNINAEPDRLTTRPSARPLSPAQLRQQTPVAASQVIDIIDKLEEQCDTLEREHTLKQRTTRNDKEPPIRASQEKNIHLVNMEGTVAMNRMLVGILKEWKQLHGM